MDRHLYLMQISVKGYILLGIMKGNYDFKNCERIESASTTHI